MVHVVPWGRSAAELEKMVLAHRQVCQVQLPLCVLTDFGMGRLQILINFRRGFFASSKILRDFSLWKLSFVSRCVPSWKLPYTFSNVYTALLM